MLLRQDWYRQRAKRVTLTDAPMRQTRDGATVTVDVTLLARMLARARFLVETLGRTAPRFGLRLGFRLSSLAWRKGAA